MSGAATPGSNLLQEAFSCIGTSTIQYLADNGRNVNDVGQWVSTYAPPINIEASVQAVARSTYVELGLDLQKNYTNIFFQKDAIDLSRDATGDRVILLDGRMYQLESLTDWYLQDGWVECLCVQVSVPR